MVPWVPGQLQVMLRVPCWLLGACLDYSEIVILSLRAVAAPLVPGFDSGSRLNFVHDLALILFTSQAPT